MTLKYDLCFILSMPSTPGDSDPVRGIKTSRLQADFGT